MLEPIEPGSLRDTTTDNNNEENNTPSDTLPPRRRRRAASRPAGPPAGGAESADAVSSAETVLPAIPAAEAAVAAGTVQDAGAAAAEEAAPPRTRRRATRKAAAPEVTASEATAPDAAAGTAAPSEGAGSAETAVAEEAAPPRTRRRATRKVAAPETTVSEAAPSETAVSEAVTAESAGTAVAEEAAPPRTRRRATRKVAAPEVTVPEPAAEPEPVVAAAEESPAEEPSVVEAEPVQAESKPATRTRRRATRRATAPAGAPGADESESQEGEGLPQDVVAQISADEEHVRAAEKAASRGRTRRRATAPETTAAEPVSGSVTAPASVAEPVEAPERSRRRAVRPAVAVFQAPVFTEPMFQTPETAAAAAAAVRPAYDDAYDAEYPVGYTDDADLDQDLDHESETGTGTVAAAEPVAAPETSGRRRRRRRGESAEPVESAPAAEEAPHDSVDETGTEAEGSAEGDDSDEYEDRPSRRRRRGGRRRRRGESADADETTDEQHDESAEDGDRESDDDEEHDEAESAESSGGGGSSSSRRRRRRRRRSGDGAAEAESGGDDPERTVVKVREPRERRSKDTEPGTGADEVQSIKGSTRLEAKKQRRREGREQGRRRVPIITEAEFLARREAVERVMVVRQNGARTQIGVLEDNVLVEHYVNKEQATSYVGNVYLGKVQNVLPSMEAAFVDIGKGRNAVLYAGEVNFEALGMANGPRRIESALKSGQSVLVQVTKDPIGHKGARLTSQVSLPGRYLVYVPEGSMTGISRKLPDTERARLKTILKKIVPEDAGVIVRTAAEGASEDELRRDVERLQGQWEDIKKKAKSGNAPTLLYGEPDMTVRVVRDIFNEDFTKVIVSGDQAWETIHGYVTHVAPDLSDRLSRWTGEADVFATYRIDEQLMKALDRKVWLPSGGSLVIDKTEAMVVVDVNTGKFTGQGGNLEETVTRNNLEAAEEIVRQLRLRDLGGIVVIDFIDMVLESNRDLVLRRLLECLGRDRTKHQVAEVTSLGLVQMTRKRVGQGLLESFSETCVHCNGRGVIVHMEQPTTAGGGGNGKRSKKRGRGGVSGTDHEHEHELVEITAETEADVETEAEIAAEVAAPAALAEPAFAPDEELFSSVAEAEAAVRGRSRRRASRKATAPAGSPKAVEPTAVEPE
ncbi:Rne/Rng family ribonuclease, partial [Streptomyces sp. NPDC050804]|uniref:Rne/Rng family ribonuclease n=1 Tax=Streptomyces sp. NPDC050804 TaxID=3154745 RepID=UPI00343BF0D9